MAASRLLPSLAIVLGLFGLAIAAPSAGAAEFPYTLEQTRSLTGDCSNPALTGFDSVPDPDCKPSYPPLPDRPSGRFQEPASVAIDAHGNEYVASYGGLGGANGRITVFSQDGEFITELPDAFGPKALAVDSAGKLYVLEHGAEATKVARYTPTVYKPEAGEITYSATRTVILTNSGIFEGGLAVDASNDHLFVAQNVVIEEYSSAAEGNSLLHSISHPDLFRSNWIAVDAERRRLYSSSCLDTIFECVVLVFEADAPYDLLEEIDGSTTPLGGFLSQKGWLGVAVDEENGHLLVADLEATKNVYEFGENYEYLSKVTVSSFQGGTSLGIAIANDKLDESASNHRYLYVPIPSSSGNVLAFKPPEVRAPKVEALPLNSVGETEAELRARIDPGTDPEGEPTEYAIEYVSEAQFDLNEFAESSIAASGTIPSSAAPRQVSAFIGGLTPSTGYRFRVVATNNLGAVEDEGGFTTYADASGIPGSECPNAALRSGPSSALSDCRAYELVTPADTNGGPVRGSGVEGDRFGMVQSAPSGQDVSFELISGALPGFEGAGFFYGDPYLATRGPAGWSTALAGPTGTQASKPQPGSFSPDQGYDFWVADGEGTALVNGEIARYLRYPDGHSELIGRGSLGTDPKARGRLITAGGTHVVFQTGVVSTPQKLEPDAPPTGTDAVYDRTRDPLTGDEETHVVSLLPGNLTPSAGEDADYLNASADGNGIAFEIGNTLYLRVGDATTYAIDSGVEFAGVSEGGKRIFYVQGGDLKAFDTTAEAAIDFTPGIVDAIPVNVAPDGARAYFVSEEAIPGSGPNPNGAEPQAAQQNLYLSEEGAISFVGTVTERDVQGVVVPSGPRVDGLGNWSETAEVKRQPGHNPSRLTPDGGTLLFQSRADLDGYDSDEAPQVYRYDSTGNHLSCLSCPPTKEPATGGAALLTTGALDDKSPFSYYGFVPNLRADGRRAFFESTEALVSGDTDGLRDVYEWEEEGVGGCSKPGGCVYLVSSGHSETADFLFGHSASGDDVFFTTNDVLVDGDESTASVYDARVDGGFAKSNAQPCSQVDLCREPAGVAPTINAPASESPGRSRATPGATRRGCPKGKRRVNHRGKPRCVKSKTAKRNKQRKADKSKGARR